MRASAIEAGLLAASAACFKGATLRVWDPNVQPAISNQWNFTVQRQFGASTTVQAGYVGQKTTHLMVATPYLQKQLLPDGTIANSPYLAGNPAIQNQIGQISGTASNGNQSYNALQVTVQKRLSRGYHSRRTTRGRSACRTPSDTIGAGGQSAPTSAYWQNLYDSKAQWGPCFYDVTSIFSGYMVYDLPFGRGRHFGKNMNKVANAIVGGWQVNAIARLPRRGFSRIDCNAVTNRGNEGPQRSRELHCGLRIRHTERLGNSRRRVSVVQPDFLCATCFRFWLVRGRHCEGHRLNTVDRSSPSSSGSKSNNTWSFERSSSTFRTLRSDAPIARLARHWELSTALRVHGIFSLR